MPEDQAEDQTINIGPWPLGANTKAKETALPDGALRQAVNVDLDDAGWPERRKGRTERIAGLTNAHSLWSDGERAFFITGGVLKQVFVGDWSTIDIVSGLHSTNHASYDSVNGRVFYSNGVDTGIIEKDGSHSPWGVEDPGQPVVTALSGTGMSMKAGRYQVAMVFVDANRQESGSTLAAVIDVAEGEVIQLSNIPQGGAKIRVFVTEPNGTILLQHAEIPLAVSSYMITSTVKGRQLETQFMQKPPAGQIVRHYRGRNYIAIDNVLVHTEAERYGLYRPLDNYFPAFPERITIVEPTLDGLFVVSDQTYYIHGNDPANMTVMVAYDQGGVEGTGCRVSSKQFNLEGAAGKVAYWFSDKGGVIGLPGGLVQPVMEERVGVKEYSRGASMFREENGISQLVTSLSGEGSASVANATDSVVLEVRQNGITP